MSIWSTGGYPPGCTQRELDYYAGGYDEPPPPCEICGDPECPGHGDEEDAMNTAEKIFDMTVGLPADQTLETLCAAIMGTLERCADPSRALVGVLALLSCSARMQEGEIRRNGQIQPLPLNQWIREAWAEKP